MSAFYKPLHPVCIFPQMLKKLSRMSGTFIENLVEVPTLLNYRLIAVSNYQNFGGGGFNLLLKLIRFGEG